MTSITGRLIGVTVLVVEDRAFLSGYIARVLDDAGATMLGPVRCTDVAAVHVGDNAAEVTCLDVTASVACEGLCARLEQRGMPYLMLMRAPEGEQIAAKPDAVLHQPFAGFQLVDELRRLAARRQIAR